MVNLEKFRRIFIVVCLCSFISIISNISLAKELDKSWVTITNTRVSLISTSYGYVDYSWKFDACSPRNAIGGKKITVYYEIHFLKNGFLVESRNRDFTFDSSSFTVFGGNHEGTTGVYSLTVTDKATMEKRLWDNANWEIVVTDVYEK